MKVKEILSLFRGYDYDVEVDLIASDVNDNAEGLNLSVNEYDDEGKMKLELDMGIEEGLYIVSKKRWDKLLEVEWKYKELCK